VTGDYNLRHAAAGVRVLRLHSGVPVAESVHRHDQQPAPPRDGAPRAPSGAYTAQYNIDRLLYFERFHYVRSAIARDKELKDWNRAHKIELIEKVNPTWVDLAAGWFKKLPLLLLLSFWLSSRRDLLVRARRSRGMGRSAVLIAKSALNGAPGEGR